jgi:hypothetical protein
MNCPIHRALVKLRTFAGLPVPVGVRWVDGKPDFRQIDAEKWLHHIQNRACVICGRGLGEWAWWIGGPLTLANHYFNDGPMHHACAVESIRLCPFLNKERLHYRGEVPHDGLAQPIEAGRPKVMYLMRGKTKAIQLIGLPDGGVCVYAGKTLDAMRQF